MTADGRGSGRLKRVNANDGTTEKKNKIEINNAASEVVFSTKVQKRKTVYQLFDGTVAGSIKTSQRYETE